MKDLELTIKNVLGVRRALNDQYVTLMYVDAENEQDEKDLEKLKGMLNGAVGILNTYAERLIKRR